jgi:plasmid stability protein
LCNHLLEVAMGQVTVRNLADEIIAAHKRRAVAHGVSLEQQLRDVLAEAARPTRDELLSRLAKCRALTPPGPRTPGEDLIREDRDNR